MHPTQTLPQGWPPTPNEQTISKGVNTHTHTHTQGWTQNTEIPLGWTQNTDNSTGGEHKTPTIPQNRPCSRWSVTCFAELMKETRPVLALLHPPSACHVTIDHEHLFTRRYCAFGVSRTALGWFRSYLSRRTQYVSDDGHMPQTHPLL